MEAIPERPSRSQAIQARRLVVRLALVTLTGLLWSLWWAAPVFGLMAKFVVLLLLAVVWILVARVVSRRWRIVFVLALAGMTAEGSVVERVAGHTTAIVLSSALNSAERIVSQKVQRSRAPYGWSDRVRGYSLVWWRSPHYHKAYSLVLFPNAWTEEQGWHSKGLMRVRGAAVDPPPDFGGFKMDSWRRVRQLSSRLWLVSGRLRSAR